MSPTYEVRFTKLFSICCITKLWQMKCKPFTEQSKQSLISQQCNIQSYRLSSSSQRVHCAASWNILLIKLMDLEAAIKYN